MTRNCAPLATRFWSKVDRRGPDECWPWTGSRNAKGYGQIGKGRRGDGLFLAHRVAWELYNETIPPGLSVLHRCDNPLCVSPAHLFLGTRADNNADRHAKGRTKTGVSRGELNGQSKLTADQVAAIRQSAATAKDLTRQYGVSAATISCIRSRIKWKHVP